MTKSVTVKTFEGIGKFIREIPTYYHSNHVRVKAISLPNENWWGGNKRVSCKLFIISADGLERSWISSSVLNRGGMRILTDHNFILVGDESELI